MRCWPGIGIVYGNGFCHASISVVDSLGSTSALIHRLALGIGSRGFNNCINPCYELRIVDRTVGSIIFIYPRCTSSISPATGVSGDYPTFIG